MYAIAWYVFSLIVLANNDHWYFIYRIAPVIIVMLTFGIVTATGKELLTKVNNCSCWCLPTYGNVLPYAFAQDNVSPQLNVVIGLAIILNPIQATARYTYTISKLLAAYSSVVSFHYLVVFVSSVITYHKILSYIKRIRLDNYYGESMAPAK